MTPGGHPLCIVVELGKPYSYGDAFYRYGHETINAEWFEGRRADSEWEDVADLLGSCIVESCGAEWSNRDVLDRYGSATYLRCVEPAAYCVRVENCDNAHYYCEFHRPQVRNNS